MIVDEPYDEPEDRPCPVCRDDDNEDVLLACDGCDAYYHTYCVGLEDVPYGAWFCDTCETQRAMDSVNPMSAERPAQRPQNLSNRRTRAQQRQQFRRNQASSSSWARVWQSVWDHLNLDLDFPFDETSGATSFSERQLHDEWYRRSEVAEMQGGRNRFRDTAPTLLNRRIRRTPSQQPEPESQEEILAWNAFEKAREIERDPTPKRKRKSATTSPCEPESSAPLERPLKRPRTRRTQEQAQIVSTSTPDSRRSSTAGPSSAVPSSTGPSLLQSMLRKIEESTPVDEVSRQTPTRLSINPNGTHSSTRPSSPGPSSPTGSNHASPRARSLTPPPSTSPRPSSPLSLTSKIEPIFPPAAFSPERSPGEPSVSHNTNDPHRQPRKLRQDSSPPRSEETSPTRPNLPYATKADLQKMVTIALRPHYQRNSVSKDQYTDINRNVSRKLYDRVGDSGHVDGIEREAYERLANDEVAKAVEGLQATF